MTWTVSSGTLNLTRPTINQSARLVIARSLVRLMNTRKAGE